MTADLQPLVLDPLTTSDLGRIRAFIGESLAAIGCAGATDALVLAVDEVCANLAEHASAGQAGNPLGVWVRVSVRRSGLDAIIVVEDRGLPFHPSNAPAPDLASEWQDRRVGGLGWFFVQQMVDVVDYETVESPSGPVNRLTLNKRGAYRAPHIASD